MPIEEDSMSVVKGHPSSVPTALSTKSAHIPCSTPEQEISQHPHFGYSNSVAMSPEDAPSTSPLAGEEGPDNFGQSESTIGSPVRVSSPTEISKTSFNLTCMTCHTHFTSTEKYARHHCVSSDGAQTEEANESSGDVERFDGIIVYNPDGSAYIIDSEMSEDDTINLDLPRVEGSIEDSQKNPISRSVAPTIPPIANALYVTKNTRAFYSALCGQPVTSLLQGNKVPDVPIVNSYRVFNVGDKHSENENINSDSKNISSSEKKQSILEEFNVPIKPILMCFMCKLSFGYVKSFLSHAMGDHSIVLVEEEKHILSNKNASAIIQNAGREKIPRISFLEPVSSRGPTPKTDLANHLPSAVSSGNSPTQQETTQPSKKMYENMNAPAHLNLKNEDDSDACGLADTSKEEMATISVKRELMGDMFDILRQHQQLQQHHLAQSLQSPLQSFRDDMFPAPQPVRTPESNRKSPISSLSANGRSSLSPVTSVSPNNFSSMQGSLSQLTGTVIGACPEHMTGRSQGVSCDKCDMILQQSRQIGGQMAFMHSRNSCKTLKCPKCNWHYKYQETLEIHMKEKHPDSESSCLYCIANQQHPRLARGETYTCGYKPYRCEVCNYSTTTKGNLSIHMQSDKHLNNMQELQNGGLPNIDGAISSVQQTSPSASVYSAPKTPTPTTTPAGSTSPASQQKPKPMWRCDVCNYETNVARNLRIHMTSEKHTHNMMVLQQNVKHMQQLNVLGNSGPSQIDPMVLLQYAQNPAAAAAMMAGMSVGGMEKPPVPEAALADIAYNQALLIQMMSGAQVSGGPSMSGNIPIPGACHGSDHVGPHFDLGLNPEALEPPPEPVPPNPKNVFSCCVCSNFDTDSLEQLNIHLAMDRSKINENEVLIVVSGNYICKLCSYKTNLKANFQLHCKTDKHLQKLQHVNHILEGGPRNEWKLKYLANTNPMHMRCNLCEYYTNSVHKLQLHAAHQRHEVLSMLFRHLCNCEVSIEDDRRIYKCMLCAFNTKEKLQLLHHIRSVRHLQMEQVHQIQRHAEGKGGAQQDIGEIFRVEESEEDVRSLCSPAIEPKEEATSPEQVHACPFCSYTTESEVSLQSHMESDHGGLEKKSSEICPLCEETCSNMAALESHALSVHSVTIDGLQRLLFLVKLSAVARREAAEEDKQSSSSPSILDQKEGSGKRPLSDAQEPPPSKYLLDDQGQAKVNSSQLKEEGASTSNGADAEGSSREEDGVEGESRVTTDGRERESELRINCNPSASTSAPRSIQSSTISTGPTLSTTTTAPTPSPSVSIIDPATPSPSYGMNMNNMAEMAAALNALTSAQIQQLQFHPMMMAGLGLAGLPLHLNPLAAMNLQPPLLPMMPHHMIDQSSLSGLNAHNSISQSNQNSITDHMIMKQQHQQQQNFLQHQQQQKVATTAAAAAAAAAAQQKRARTRITDDQLKILRAHFDINNSPSEEQINEMAKQSGLPPKVIKHWFRNTLFKERQRCKDSPYNFSIPPSTSLNLEEYEKTGETKVTHLLPGEGSEIHIDNKSKDESSNNENNLKSDISGNKSMSLIGNEKFHEKKEPLQSHETASEFPNLNNNNPIINNNNNEPAQPINFPHLNQNVYAINSPSPSPLPQHPISQNGPQLVSSASSSPVGHMSASLSSPFSPLIASQNPLSLSSFISSQLEGNPLLKLSHTTTSTGNANLIPSGCGISPSISQVSVFPSTPTTPTPSVTSLNSGKRANRTRFTDYQIKVLQEFFENNAYPKDDDLEYLSKLLNLSPRVIVVWFQNARQKARKVYENQPPIDPTEENAGRFTRTPGLNYQCKKCLLVFQRYYELIRHQKTHCFKEEDAKRSAQAQAAAAQAAALYADDNSNNSNISESSQNSRELDPMKALEHSFPCEKCSLSFDRLEQWQEHQIVHLMNPALFMNKTSESPFSSIYNPTTSAAVSFSQSPSRQSFAQRINAEIPQMSPENISVHQSQPLPLPLQPSPLLMPPSPLKRKTDESEDERDMNISIEAQRDKRLRTTILPEQLDYLYQKYQMEANPSRKMLETIAQEVGLKKRVVQVWFQNTRARERKGQFRAHAQVINKKCPFCPAIFKVKSALESHLSTKHADQYSKGNINIDALPDVEDAGVGNFNLTSSASCSQVSQVISSSLFSSSDITEDSISKYHEEAIKRYLNDVHLAADGPRREGDTPLDLSKPFDLVRPIGFDSSNLNDGLSNDNTDYWSDEDRFQIEISEHDEIEGANNSFESNPTSPVSSTAESTKLNNHINKRFRTQMSGTQVKIMKAIFKDYKTPTMAECEMLGREIGLAKRVVQVWFQNARAKGKKATVAIQKVLGTEQDDGTKLPDDCKFCNFTYSHKYSIQDHIISREHIENLRKYLVRLKEESDNSNLQNHSGVASSEDPKSGGNLTNHLQMAHLMALGNAMPANHSLDDKKSGSEEELSRLQLLHQMYQQMGLGGLPGTAHPLLQHAMMAGAGLVNAIGQSSTSGTHISMLQIPVAAKKELDSIFQFSGDSKASFTLDGEKLLPGQGHNTEGDVGWVCKNCRFVYPSSSLLECHQKLLSHEKGSLRLAQVMYACKKCKKALATFKDYSAHLSKEHKVDLLGESAVMDLPDILEKNTKGEFAAQQHVFGSLEDEVKIEGQPVTVVNSTKQDKLPKFEPKQSKEILVISPLPAEINVAKTSSDNKHRPVGPLGKVNHHKVKFDPEPTKVPIPKVLGENLKDQVNIRTSSNDSAYQINSDFGKLQYSEHRISCESNPSYKEPYSYDSYDLSKLSLEVDSNTGANYLEKGRQANYYGQQFSSHQKESQLANFPANFTIQSNPYNQHGGYNYQNSILTGNMNQNVSQYAANFQTDYSPYQVNASYSQHQRQSCPYPDTFPADPLAAIGSESTIQCFPHPPENHMPLEPPQDDMSVNNSSCSNGPRQGNKCVDGSSHTQHNNYPFVVNSHASRPVLGSDTNSNINKLASVMQSTPQ